MDKVLRAAKYIRVSTDEQALHGYSLPAQNDTLDEYCQEKGYKIVGDYVDDGVSAGKSPWKRPAMKQLLKDVEAGKIDVVVFTKLDRWFRNVADYYKVQEVFERHNVVWHAVLEHYDTTTADGRLKVNIMLSVAANERERTSERIKAVFKYKAKNKEYYGGGHTPFGYKRIIDEQGLKRLVKDPETEPIVNDFWDMMLKTNNLYGTSKQLNQRHNVFRTMKQWKYIFDNPLYYGYFAGVEDFCESYIDKKTWDELHARRPIKKTQKNRVYLFTGLLRCPSCGKVLASCSKIVKGVIYKSYRCQRHTLDLCDYKKTITEAKLEQYLLDNLPRLIGEKLRLEAEKIEIEKATPKKKPKTDVAKLKEQLRKLNVMYMAGGKTDEEYLQETAEIKALIDQASQETPQVEQDFTHLKKMLKTDYRSLYEVMTDENKRRFWRGIFKSLTFVGSELDEEKIEWAV